MSNDIALKRQNDLELCDAMLEQTSQSMSKLLCKKAEYSMNGEDVPLGKEYIAYPMDALHGVCQWQDDHIVEQRTGRIADKSVLKVEKDQLIFNGETFAKADGWQPQYAMPLEDPESGEIISFVSCATGAKIAITKLIQATARDFKKGKGTLTPLVRLSAGTFPTTDFGLVPRPAFEIVPDHDLQTELNDKAPF
jgi:hypothetical protein